MVIVVIIIVLRIQYITYLRRRKQLDRFYYFSFCVEMISLFLYAYRCDMGSYRIQDFCCYGDFLKRRYRLISESYKQK